MLFGIIAVENTLIMGQTDLNIHYKPIENVKISF